METKKKKTFSRKRWVENKCRVYALSEMLYTIRTFLFKWILLFCYAEYVLRVYYSSMFVRIQNILVERTVLVREKGPHNKMAAI